MIPVKVDSVANRFPYVTVLLIAACTAAFLGRAHIAQYGYGFIPVDFVHSLLRPGRDTAAVALTLVLSFFQHSGWLHLVSNMWYLWLFGATIELSAGRLLYVVVYVVCGVLSMVIQAASSPLSDIPVIGASGAIAGVMGACLVLMPLSRTVMWIPPLFFVRIPSFIFLILWFALQYYSMRSAPSHGSGVAWWAHIGGFACGFLMAIEMRRRGWKAPGGGREVRRRSGAARARTAHER